MKRPCPLTFPTLTIILTFIFVNNGLSEGTMDLLNAEGLAEIGHKYFNKNQNETAVKYFTAAIVSGKVN